MKNLAFIILPLLLPMAAQAQLWGPLSGVLPGDSTYTVIGDIWVSGGDTLIIEAGAILIFDSAVQFHNRGFLNASGTIEDSVKFIHHSGLTWGGLDFNDSASDSSRLEYCSVIGSASGGIYCDSSSPLIKNCLISDNYTGEYGGGICCYYSNPVISNCTIGGNAAYNGGGIYCYNSAPTITDCIIRGNSAEFGGGGICCIEFSSLNVTYCIISDNTAEAGAGIYCDFSSMLLSNSTISRNRTNGGPGGGISCYYSPINVINTIVESNVGSYGVYLYNSPNTAITYSDFYNNQCGNFNSPPMGVGTITTTNANGDSCDIYNNIFLNALFYSTTGDSAYYLTANSPCIDAGDPASPQDPDNTIADIGAYYFDQSPPPPPVIDDLTIAIAGDDVILQWSPFTVVISYNIYRSETPYFEIGGMTPIASVTFPQYIDAGAMANGAFYYKVTTVILNTEY